MQTVNIKRKELNVKYPSRLIVEDEIQAEPIQFVISSASDINNYDQLTFYLQYRNNLDEYGFELLETTYDTDTDKLYLLWTPSALFAKEKGKVEIQIVGYLSGYSTTEDEVFVEDKAYYTYDSGVYNEITFNTDGSTSPYIGQNISEYSEEIEQNIYDYNSETRWSSVKAPLSLPENIYNTEVTLPDVNYIDKSLTDMKLMTAKVSDMVENVADMAETVEGDLEEIRGIKEEVVQARDKAYTYMEGAETAYKDTLELKEYLEKYTFKAFKTTIGNGGKTYTVSHGLSTENLIVQCWPVDGGETPEYVATRIDEDILQLDFSENIRTNGMDVIISAIDRSLMEEVPIENVSNISFITPSEILNVLNGEEE